MSRKGSSLDAYVFLALTLGFLLVFLIFPLGYSLSKSLIVDGRLDLSFYEILITSPQFLDLIFNSINISLSATLLSIIFALPFALLLNKYQFKRAGFYEFLLILPLFGPPFVGAVGFRKIFSSFGPLNLFLMKTGIIDSPIFWLDSAIGIVILQAFHFYPIIYLNIRASLSHIDSSLIEAGALFGASKRQLIRRIILPLVASGIFAGGSIVFISSLTDLGTPLIFGYRDLLSVRIFDYVEEINSNPLGYCLISFVLALSLLLFSISRFALHTGHSSSQKGATKARNQEPSIWAERIFFLLLAIFVVVASLPHISVVILSLTKKWFMTTLPEEITLSHYAQLFEHELTNRSIKISLFLSFLATIFNIVFGTLIAFLLTKSNLKGRYILDLLVMVPLATPGIALAFGYLGSFGGTLLDPRINPLPLLAIGYSVRRLPYIVRSISAGLEETENSLEQAGRVFGGSRFFVFKRITLPIIFPNIAAGALICFSFSMLEISESLILALDEKYFPITKTMYALLARPDGPYIASAMGVLGMILLSISIFVASKLSGKSMGNIFRF